MERSFYPAPLHPSDEFPGRDYGRPVETRRGIDFRGVLRRQYWLILLVVAATMAPIVYHAMNELPSYTATGVVRMIDLREGSIGAADATMMRTLGRSADPLLSQIEVLLGRGVGGEVVDRTALRLLPVGGAFPPGFEALHVAAGATADTVRVYFHDEGYRVRSAGSLVSVRYGEVARLDGVSLRATSKPEKDVLVAVVMPREAAIDKWRRSVSAEPVNRTDVVRISYTSADPSLAQRVVNATIETFQALNAESLRQQSSRRRVFLEEQLADATGILAAAQSGLASARSRAQAWSSQEKMVVQQQTLSSLAMRREELDADRKMHAQLLAGLQDPSSPDRTRLIRTIVSAPGIAANPVISQVYGRLVEYQAEHAGLISGSSGRTAAHPDVQRYQSLIASTEEELIDAVRSHIAAIDIRIDAIDALRSRTSAELQRLPQQDAEEARLALRVESLQRITDQIMQDVQRARIAEAVQAGQIEVVYLAPHPTHPVSGGGTMRIIMGLILGLFFGAGAALIRESSNKVVRDRDEIEQMLRVQGLATIPPAPSRRKSRHLTSRATRPADRVGFTLPGISNPTLKHSAYLEAFRMLGANLIYAHPGAEHARIVTVTSAAPGDGKTTTSVNMAIALTQFGFRVLLVDGDAWRGRLHRIFGVDRSPGLHELLRGEVPPEEAIRETELDGVSIISTGSTSPDGNPVYARERLREHLARFSTQYDVILIDSPPILSTADASVLGTVADGVVLVIRAGRTEREAAREAAQQLQHIGANVIGAVLNDPDSVVHGYHDYYKAYSAPRR